ncbi:hypothetical protein XELAEV_18042242mg [Xenopus laevis]|uniref:Uncharacterized protein n=1 Tax=Xenopus laevis TaxID=8355 RepID=A0A974H5T9_XENLA|nr:hypothetical protein XELAEV_18042242mg [Xenopus laevis]
MYVDYCLVCTAKWRATSLHKTEKRKGPVRYTYCNPSSPTISTAHNKTASSYHPHQKPHTALAKYQPQASHHCESDTRISPVSFPSLSLSCQWLPVCSLVRDAAVLLARRDSRHTPALYFKKQLLSPGNVREAARLHHSLSRLTASSSTSGI